MGHLGVQDKAELMRELLEKYNVTWDEILFIGNDVQDLVFMRLSGFPAAPANAIPEVKEEAIFVSKSAGGYGAVRDILQFVLESKGHWNEIINKE